MNSTIDPKEIEKFSKISDEWWSPTGKFKPLHKFKPVRINFIKKTISKHFGLDEKNLALKILDVGCGGGLISEPFANFGAEVTAIDASTKNIEVAKIHAQKSQLKINYLVSTAEELAQNNEKFDVVLALEVIEHVADVKNFVISCSKLVKPGGLLFVATINRTIKSFALAKIAVEFILRWLPKGTHDWKKFLKPSEINFEVSQNGLELKCSTGFSYDILNDVWSETKNLDVNYAMVFSKN